MCHVQDSVSTGHCHCLQLSIIYFHLTILNYIQYFQMIRQIYSSFDGNVSCTRQRDPRSGSQNDMFTFNWGVWN